MGIDSLGNYYFNRSIKFHFPEQSTSTVNDFRETASKDFFGLAPGSSAGLLKVPYPITATGFEQEQTGWVTLVRAGYQKPVERTVFEKPRTYV
jgi:glutaminyl-tRNA synthetase